jgi:glycosyltransferase 2 family protein
LIPKRLRGLVQIVISLILMTLILRTVSWVEVRDALQRIDLRWLAVAWALFILGVVVRAARWQVLLDALGLRRPLGELVNWYFVGSFFNVILPTGFGGDAVRAAELAQDTGRFGQAVNSVVVDRYLGLIVLLAMGLVAWLAAPGAAPAEMFWLTAALFAGGILAAWLICRPWWKLWGQRPDRFGAAVRWLKLPQLSDAVAPYDRHTILRGLGISLVFNLLNVAWNVAIGRGLGLDLPLAVYLVFVPLTSVALLLPAFGGLGVRELTYVGLFGSVGVPRAVALALSLGVYCITVATGLIGGILYLVGGLQRARSREARR